jgi:hypothetical protein
MLNVDIQFYVGARHVSDSVATDNNIVHAAAFFVMYSTCLLPKITVSGMKLSDLVAAATHMSAQLP